MSDTPEKQPMNMTNEKLEVKIAEKKTAQKLAKEKSDAEMKFIVDKYSALAGKTFTKDGKEFVTVDKYIGVHTIHGGIRAHLLSVEVKGIRSWTPVASKFIEEYTEVETKSETATSKII